MTPDQAAELAAYLKKLRESAGVSQRQLAERVGISDTQLTRLEQGGVRNPRPEVLSAYAEAAGVPLADIYTAAGIPLPKGLPALRPYLRAKYRSLSADDAAKVEAFIDDLTRQHNNGGPRPGEDEA